MRAVLPHAPDCVLNLDLTNDLVAMAFDLLEQLALLWNHTSERSLQIRLRRGRVVPSDRGKTRILLAKNLPKSSENCCLRRKKRRTNSRGSSEP